MEILPSEWANAKNNYLITDNFEIKAKVIKTK